MRWERTRRRRKGEKNVFFSSISITCHSKNPGMIFFAWWNMQNILFKLRQVLCHICFDLNMMFRLSNRQVHQLAGWFLGGVISHLCIRHKLMPFKMFFKHCLKCQKQVKHLSLPSKPKVNYAANMTTVYLLDSFWNVSFAPFDLMAIFGFPLRERERERAPKAIISFEEVDGFQKGFLSAKSITDRHGFVL